MQVGDSRPKDVSTRISTPRPQRASTLPPHAFADPRAQAAHDALPVFFARKASSNPPVAFGEPFQDLGIRAAGGEQFDEHFAVLTQHRGVGVDLGIPAQRVVAGGHQARAAAFHHLHGAHPAMAAGSSAGTWQ